MVKKIGKIYGLKKAKNSVRYSAFGPLFHFAWLRLKNVNFSASLLIINVQNSISKPLLFTSTEKIKLHLYTYIYIYIYIYVYKHVYLLFVPLCGWLNWLTHLSV